MLLAHWADNNTISFTKPGNQKGKCLYFSIMLATYSTNKIIVIKRHVSEGRKKVKNKKMNINQTNTRTQTVKQRNAE